MNYIGCRREERIYPRCSWDFWLVVYLPSCESDRRQIRIPSQSPAYILDWEIGSSGRLTVSCEKGKVGRSPVKELPGCPECLGLPTVTSQNGILKLISYFVYHVFSKTSLGLLPFLSPSTLKSFTATALSLVINIIPPTAVSLLLLPENECNFEDTQTMAQVSVASVCDVCNEKAELQPPARICIC